MLRCNDPTCPCQPAPPKPNRQIQLTLHEPGSSKAIPIHHKDADLDIAFDIINKRVVLQETIYRVTVTPLTTAPSGGGSGSGSGSGNGNEINTSRTPLPKRPISWTFTLNFPIDTNGNTKSKSSGSGKNSTSLHFQNLLGLNDNSLLLTLTLPLQTTPGIPKEGGPGPGQKIHTKHRIYNFTRDLEESHLYESVYRPLLRAQHQQHHYHQEEEEKEEGEERKKKAPIQLQIHLPAERLHGWRTVALIARTFRRISAEQWCQLVHLPSVPRRPPGLAGLDWRGVERLVYSSSCSSSPCPASSSSSPSSSSSSGSSSGRLGRNEIGDGVTMGVTREYTAKKKKKTKKKKTGQKKKTKNKKAEKEKKKKKEEKDDPLPEDADDPVIGVGDYCIFRELYTW